MGFLKKLGKKLKKAAKKSLKFNKAVFKAGLTTKKGKIGLSKDIAGKKIAKKASPYVDAGIKAYAAAVLAGQAGGGQKTTGFLGSGGSVSEGTKSMGFFDDIGGYLDQAQDVFSKAGKFKQSLEEQFSKKKPQIPTYVPEFPTAPPAPSGIPTQTLLIGVAVVGGIVLLIMLKGRR